MKLKFVVLRIYVLKLFWIRWRQRNIKKEGVCYLENIVLCKWKGFQTEQTKLYDDNKPYELGGCRNSNECYPMKAWAQFIVSFELFLVTKKINAKKTALLITFLSVIQNGKVKQPKNRTKDY